MLALLPAKVRLCARTTASSALLAASAPQEPPCVLSAAWLYFRLPSPAPEPAFAVPTLPLPAFASLWLSVQLLLFTAALSAS